MLTVQPYSPTALADARQGAPVLDLFIWIS